MAISPRIPKLKIDDEQGFFTDLPNLKTGKFRVTSPPTPATSFSKVYNCFAYTVGKRQWWWPQEGGCWPRDCRHGDTLESFVFAYKHFGFEPCADGTFEKGKTKIAIYMSGPTVKHVAIQFSSRSGIWRSKCGYNVDIEHTLQDLEGGIYGFARHFLVR